MGTITEENHTMQIVLKNDFHNTTAKVRLHPTESLSDSQINSVRHKLCGLADCTCSGDLGTRGEQTMPNGWRLDSGYRLIEAERD